ncbi:hypothetical protein ACGTNG_12460 [Halomonas sp. 1390]|uniref:hypothetical protein n=1 Tax=Halomonas sp. B23F22_3 TaxID=3459516 RepID=UPI00373E122D
MIESDTLLRVTRWRKRLERNGWTGIRRRAPPRDRLIEYHLIWRGHLVSGRVRLADTTDAGWWQPGTPAYLFMRGVDVTDGAWRVCRAQSALVGQVHRRMPV